MKGSNKLFTFHHFSLSLLFLISCLFLFSGYQIFNQQKILFPIVSLCLSTGIFFLLHSKLKFSKWILILCLLLTSFLVFGEWIYWYGDIGYIFLSWPNICLFLVSFFSYGTLIYFLLFQVFYFLDKYQNTINKNSICNFIFNKHPFLFAFLFILICGIPYILAFYPGTVHWDGFRQLDYYYGLVSWSNRHPAFSTFLMGSIINFGKNLINFNFGLFLYTFLQFLFSCFVFAKVIVLLKKMNAPLFLRIFSLLFFALFPLWPINAYTLVKDTSYYLIFVLFFITLLDFHIDIDVRKKKRTYLLLFFLGLLLTLLRNNGILVVILSYLGFAIFYSKKKFGILIIVIIACNSIQNTVILPLFNISQSNIREALSIPIQQTGRYIKYYQNEITEENKETLTKIFNTDLESIADDYNPELSDPIKFQFQSKYLSEFLKVWLENFFHHPKVYIDAVLENYYGYFYPNTKEEKDGLGCYEITQSKKLKSEEFDFSMIENLKPIRDGLEQLAYSIRSIPLLGMLYSCGFYTWIIFIGAFYLIYKKRKEDLILTIPLFTTIFICVISPVNAYIRYMLPVMATAPLFVAYLFYKQKEK